MATQSRATRETDESLALSAVTGDDRALDGLLHRYAGLAKTKSQAFFLLGADKDDLIQEGMIGLFKAIRDFDPVRNPCFRAFAELCISRQVMSAIKSAARMKHSPLNSYVSLNATLPGTDDPLGDTLTAGAHDPVEYLVASEEIEAIRAFCGQILSSFEVDVLTSYLEGRNYRDIAVTLGRPAKSIDNARQRIKRKLETFLNSRDDDLGSAVHDHEPVQPVLRVFQGNN